MAASKSQKIQTEIDKVKAKISEQQARLKELEQKHREAENEEIVDIVRGMSVSLEELPLVLQRLRDSGTSGQSVQKSVGTPLVMLLGLFQSTDVKDLIELCHHTPDVRGRKPTVFHSVDDIAPAGIVAPRLGKQGRQFGVILHVSFLLDKSFGSATLISLARHKTAILSMTLPRGRWPGGASGQLVRLRIVAVGWLVPLAALVLFARSPAGEVTAHPPPGSSLYGSGPPLFSC